MSRIEVSIVDVYAVRYSPAAGLECLVLRRAQGSRCPGSWEAVHGHIEPAESPAAAALRELREETGLAPARLYNLSRMESFYLHRTDIVALIPVFVAFVQAAGQPQLGAEHDAAEWLPFGQAGGRLSWPRERRALEDIASLFPGGEAGALDDVLRVS